MYPVLVYWGDNASSLAPAGCKEHKQHGACMDKRNTNPLHAGLQELVQLCTGCSVMSVTGHLNQVERACACDGGIAHTVQVVHGLQFKSRQASGCYV